MTMSWRTMTMSWLVMMAGCSHEMVCPVPDAGPVTNCVGAPHESGLLVAEPDGTMTCLPGACDPGWADCDGNPENGCEASLGDSAHCGACNVQCKPGETCAGSPVLTDNVCVQ